MSLHGSKLRLCSNCRFNISRGWNLIDKCAPDRGQTNSRVYLPHPSCCRRLSILSRAMGSVAGDAARLSYPPTRRDNSVVDMYHGVPVADPYRWLEDPESEDTKEFVASQVELAESVLAGCFDRENLRREVTRLFDHPRHGAPFRRGNKYFYFHNSGLQAQSVLYVQVCHQTRLIKHAVDLRFGALRDMLLSR
jgi:hypothetical protein